MKYLIAAILSLSFSFSALAQDRNATALEKAMSASLKSNVKILKISRTLNPIDMYINLLDNVEIKRIKFTADGNVIRCDLLVYESGDRVRLERCDSLTVHVSDGLIYF